MRSINFVERWRRARYAPVMLCAYSLVSDRELFCHQREQRRAFAGDLPTPAQSHLRCDGASVSRHLCAAYIKQVCDICIARLRVIDVRAQL
jgi:hypothetical protein